MQNASSVQPLTGYFTLFKFIRGKTLEELERTVGYRSGRLTSKGALLFRLLRLPRVEEFEVRGYTLLREQDWNEKVAPQRSAELQRTKAIYNRLNLPDFDQQQKMNALSTMSLQGESTPVKLIPLEKLSIDSTPDGYVRGPGIPQWTILAQADNSDPVKGELLLTVPAGTASSIPWKI